MPKPKQIFLLEVSYTGGRPYRAPGGGIFRTEKDMQTRINTIKGKRAWNQKSVDVEFTISKIEGNWEHVRTEHYQA